MQCCHFALLCYYKDKTSQRTWYSYWANDVLMMFNFAFTRIGHLPVMFSISNVSNVYVLYSHEHYADIGRHLTGMRMLSLCLPVWPWQHCSTHAHNIWWLVAEEGWWWWTYDVASHGGSFLFISRQKLGLNQPLGNKTTEKY